MNIESKSAEQGKSKTQRFSDKISSEIWETISNPDENLIKRLNAIFDKSFKLISKSDLNNREVQKKICDQILVFMNELLWKIDAKKFYNNIPTTDIKKFSKKSLWEQFMHNIYWKQRKLYYRNEIGWGSCSYWTIIFKHFFDELEKRWMDIKSEIFFYPMNDIEGGWWHSGVIVSFQWKEYLADFGWFNHHVDDNLIIQSIDSLNEQYNSKTFDRFRADSIEKYYKLKDKPDNLLFFHDTGAFVNRRSQRTRKNATIEFTPKLDWKISKDVKFEFQPDKIYLTIDGIQHVFIYKKDKKHPSADVSDEKFFDYFISHIEHVETTEKTTKKPLNIKWEKTIFTEYLELIRKKISIQKLRTIYGI